MHSVLWKDRGGPPQSPWRSWRVPSTIGQGLYSPVHLKTQHNNPHWMDNFMTTTAWHRICCSEAEGPKNCEFQVPLLSCLPHFLLWGSRESGFAWMFPPDTREKVLGTASKQHSQTTFRKDTYDQIKQTSSFLYLTWWIFPPARGEDGKLFLICASGWGIEMSVTPRTYMVLGLSGSEAEEQIQGQGWGSS